MAKAERRRLSRIVHDHKGNAVVEWFDSPDEREVRQVLEVEDTSTALKRLDPRSLSIESDDTHNPYTRIPEPPRRRDSSTRTDLRKLSAWIKLMRELEEAKRRRDEEE